MAQKINVKQSKKAIVKAFLSANASQTSPASTYGSFKVNLNTIDNTLAPEFTLSSNGVLVPAGVSWVKVSFTMSVGSLSTVTAECYAAINVNGTTTKATTYFPGFSSGSTSPRHWSVEDIFEVTPGDIIYAYATSSTASNTMRFDTGTRLIVEAIG